MVLAVCMTVSSFEVSAYAAEQGTAEEKIIQEDILYYSDNEEGISSIENNETENDENRADETENGEEAYYEDEDLELNDTGVTVASFSIKDVPKGKSETSSTENNAIKTTKGIGLEFAITLSDGKKPSVIYSMEDLADDLKRDADKQIIGDNDIVVSLKSSDTDVIRINSYYNSIWGYEIGSSEITATAFLKKDYDASTKTITSYLEDTKTIKVIYPTGELLSSPISPDRYFVSFNGETEYIGWAKRSSTGKFSATTENKTGNYYFLDGSDYIDTDNYDPTKPETPGRQKVRTSDDSDSDKTVSNRKITNLAKDCSVWINGALYKFDSDGKCVKFWNRLKSVDMAEADGSATESITVGEGSRYTISVIYTPEDGSVTSGNLTEDLSVRFSSTEPSFVTVDNIRYEESTDINGEKVITCYADVVALAYSSTPVVITASSGDEDNKYRAYYDTNETPASLHNYLEDTLSVTTTYAKGWQKIDGGTYYVEDDGFGGVQFHEGWLTLSGGKEYYFYTADDETEGRGTKGAMAVGDVELKKREDPTKLEYYRFDSDGKLIEVIEKHGWQTVGDNKFYYDADGNPVKGSVLIDGKRYLFDASGVNLVNGVFKVADKIYYVNKSGIIITGWQSFVSPDDPEGKKRKYYLDSTTGELRTGFVTISGKTYYLCEQAFDGYYLGQTPKGYIKLDATNVPGSSSTMNGEYYFDNSGVIKTGWQKFKADGVHLSWHYFALNSGVEIAPGSEVLQPDGKSYIRSVTDDGVTKDYYFPNDGTPYIFNGVNSRGIPIKGDLYDSTNGYYINAKGEAIKGWIRFKADGTNYSWHYFAMSDGKEIPFTEVEGTNIFTAADGKSKWRKITDGAEHTYYFNSDTSVVKGFKDIEGIFGSNDNIKRKYYFDPTYGYAIKGEFEVSKFNYYADDDCVVLCNGWNDFDDNGDLVIDRTCYYSSNGKRVSGWNTLAARDASITGKKSFYFGNNGALASGPCVINNKYYLLCDAPAAGVRDKGELLKDYYGSTDGLGTDDASKVFYYTDRAGVILAGWRRFKADGMNYSWHLFDSNGGKEIKNNGSTVIIDLPPEIGGKVEGWVVVTIDGVANKYYFKNNKVLTGWQKITDAGGVTHKYYFDTATGMLLSGKVVIGKTVYYLDDDGKQMSSGIVEVNGNYMYLDKSGAAKKNWFTVDGSKYYANPDTGYLSIGFEKIKNKMYYFCEVKALAGRMVSGFFTVPKSSQDYYDPARSNMYYADANGVVATSGWKTVAHNPKVSDSQKWSYYLDPAVAGHTASGDEIAGEVVLGDVIINDDGTVEKYVPESGQDITKMYSFDEKTGARAKTVLYFHGGAYNEDLYSEDHKKQYDAVMSIAKYMNTDKHAYNPSDRMIVAGYTDLSGYGISGYSSGFPLAACESVYGETELYKKQKEAGLDIAKYDATEGYVAGSDGAIDIGDIEAFVLGLYSEVIGKFGPNNVVLMGASSGGAMALSCLINAANKGIAQPAETILFCPWLDASMSNGNAKRYSSGGVDYATLLYKGARVTRDATYKAVDGKYPYVSMPGPGAKAEAAWFASPILATNNPDYAGISSKITVYTGTKDPCYPDINNFTKAAKAAGSKIQLVTYGAGHGYMFSNSSAALKTILGASWIIMTQDGVK